MKFDISLKDNISKKDASLLFQLAEAILEGDSLEADEETVMRLFAAAAKAGETKGYGRIGEMIEDRDISKASLYYRKGASLGDPFSMVQLGCLYEDEGRMGDAIICYERAAKENEPEAMYRYGLAITDPEEKVNWLRKAADAGYLYAPRALGEVYEMKENEGLALFWYRQGFEMGDERLAERISLLESGEDEEIDVAIEYDDEETM